MTHSSENAAILPLGLTMGDAAGIGPELVVKLFVQGLPAPTVVYGDVNALKAAAAQLGADVFIHGYGSVSEWRQHIRQTQTARRDESEQVSGKTNSSPPEHGGQGQQQQGGAEQPCRHEIAVVQCADPLPADLPLGQVNAQAGLASYQFLIGAIRDAMGGEIAAIVTAPLNKLSLKAGGINFPGHTEILAHEAGVPRVAMMLLNDELRVILTTIHVALSEVPSLITFENELEVIRLANKACQMLGLAAARIAVAGLNPHAGEGGRFGSEDETVIRPAIDAARKEGLNVTGPYPGDTVFMRARRGDFDIVVAQYHDQGLIPVKYLGVDNGVNVTVGLPFIRTSVDHGTAYDIAGQGIADPSSLRVACELALKMHRASV